MPDPNIAEFTSRLARIERARARGEGFEAVGTLGRSFYTRTNPRYRRRLSIPVLRPLLLALALGIAVKSVFLVQLGRGAYEARVAGMMAGDRVDRLGGWLMQADPLTVALARQISTFSRLSD